MRVTTQVGLNEMLILDVLESEVCQVVKKLLCDNHAYCHCDPS